VVFDVSQQVHNRLTQLGEVGQRWLDQLPATIEALAQQWGCDVSGSLGGGSAACVVNATDRHGRPAVLKIAIPAGGEGYSDFDSEVLALSLGGDSYVDVYEVDPVHRALLLERLGSSLEQLNVTVEQQISVLAATLMRSWKPVPAEINLPTGLAQASSLTEFIQRHAATVGHRCQAATIQTALTYLNRRINAFDPAATVLIHGDAHPGNVLQTNKSTANDGDKEFKLIDPEGLLSEPAHDLGVVMRDWCAELNDGNPIALAQSWCHQLSAATGVAPGPIWEWAFIERVSTGLLLAHLGDPSAALFLSIADQLASVRI
jgi:streptomycin 6-kinase